VKDTLAKYLSSERAGYGSPLKRDNKKSRPARSEDFPEGKGAHHPEGMPHRAGTSGSVRRLSGRSREGELAMNNTSLASYGPTRFLLGGSHQSRM